MEKLARVRLSGDLKGDYVVVHRHAGGVRIAPEQPEGRPKVVALKKTSLACPSQWEGALKDGRIIYARYRHGELSVGVGDDIEEAVRNGMSDQALYTGHIGDGLDGFMNFDELEIHLHGVFGVLDGPGRRERVAAQRVAARPKFHRIERRRGGGLGSGIAAVMRLRCDLEQPNPAM